MANLQRNRTRGGFYPSPDTFDGEQIWVNCAMSSWSVISGPVSPIVIGSFSAMKDFVTESFKKRQIRGEIIMNPMGSVRTDISHVGGFGFHISKSPNIICGGIPRAAESRYNGSWFTALMAILHNASSYTTPFKASTIVSQKDISDLAIEVSTKCHAKRGNADNNLFESIAEYRQVLSMLKNPVKGLHRLFSKHESTLVRAKTGASAWLQYRYGIKPLINDITGIIEGMQKKVGNMRVTVRSKGEILRNEQRTLTWTNPTIFTLTYGIQTTESIRMRAMSLDEYFVDRLERVGFASKGLITVPWELVPYSFVADWFVNLGDFLQAIIPLPSLKQLGSCLSTEHIIQNVYQPISMAGIPPWSIVTPCSGLVSVTETRKARDPLRSPGIVIRNDFRFDDAVRIADSVSLILQKMNRVFRR